MNKSLNLCGKIVRKKTVSNPASNTDSWHSCTLLIQLINDVLWLRVNCAETTNEKPHTRWNCLSALTNSTVYNKYIVPQIRAKNIKIPSTMDSSSLPTLPTNSPPWVRHSLQFLFRLLMLLTIKWAIYMFSVLMLCKSAYSLCAHPLVHQVDCPVTAQADSEDAHVPLGWGSLTLMCRWLTTEPLSMEECQQYDMM